MRQKTDGAFLNHGLRKHPAGWAFPILFLLISFSHCLGNGFRNPPEGATGLGRIGGKIAQVDDPTAISLNPANLTEMHSPSFSSTSTTIYADTKFTSSGGQTTNAKQPLKILPDFFAAWPFEDGKYVLGLGVETPFGQSTVWGKQSIFRYSIPWYSGLTVVNINPTFAFKLTDNLSIGAGADLFLSQLDMRQFYRWTNLTGDPADSDGEAKFLGQGFGGGGNFGMTWQVAPHHRLALTWQSAVDVQYSGDFRLSNIPTSTKLPPPFRGVTSVSDYYTGITFPNIVTLGYGIDLNEAVRLEADLEWVQFSKFNSLRTNIQNNDILLSSTTTHENWNDVENPGIGADWKFSRNWILRGGYQYLQTPIPDNTFSPTLPDANKHLVSVGIGYSRNHQTFEASFAETFFADRIVTSNENTAFNGTYKLSSHLFSFSYRYSFN